MQTAEECSQICPTDPAVVLFRLFLPLIAFLAVKDSGRKGGGGGEVEDPGLGEGGGDDLNLIQPAGDQHFNLEVEKASLSSQTSWSLFMYMDQNMRCDINSPFVALCFIFGSEGILNLIFSELVYSPVLL